MSPWACRIRLAVGEGGSFPLQVAADPGPDGLAVAALLTQKMGRGWGGLT